MHKYVAKVWGVEEWIVNKPEYCGKKLYFEAGKATSFHYHIVKDEVLFVETGEVDVDYGHEQTITLFPGESFHIKPGAIHRISALVDSIVFEFSTEHKDEDVVRGKFVNGKFVQIDNT